MSQCNHARNTKNGRKALPPHARSSKPPPLRRGPSHNNSHLHTQPHTSTPTKSASPGWSKNVGVDVEVHHIDDEESGMASFLQFCATCEKQIITPGASILYCSEACRKKDFSRPTSIQSIQSIQSVKSPLAMPSTCSYFENHPPVDILPQRSPTVLRPVSLCFSDLSSADEVSSTDDSSYSSIFSRRDSGATSYLEQFHADYSSAQNTRRPRVHRAQTTTDSSNIPSLVHSPSSSYGTIASNASYRPLPLRHNPSFTSTHPSRKSIDLVIPYPTTILENTLKDASLKSSASTLTSFRVAEAGDVSYEKRPPSWTKSSRSSSTSDNKKKKNADQALRQLFCHDAMKAPPTTI